MKYLMFTLIISLLSACGEGRMASEQDPLAEYQKAKNAVPLYDKKDTEAQRMNPTHEIKVKGDLNFTQGEEHKVDIEVQILTANPDSVKSSLALDSYSKSLGAKIVKQAKNQYQLVWKPSAQLLAYNEQSRVIPAKIELVIDNSTPSELKTLFKYTHKEKALALLVSEDKSVPRILDSTVKVTNGQKLSLGQKTKFIFYVEASDIKSIDDVEVLVNPETQKPSGELLQASAGFGVKEGALRDEAKLTTDGNFRAKYTIEFDSTSFWENIQDDIQSNYKTRAKLRNGRYSVAEARLVIVAKNNKSKQTVSKEYFIDVELGFKPDQVEIQSKKDFIDLQSSSKGKRSITNDIIVKSSNSQGNLELISFTPQDDDMNVSCKLVASETVEKECATGQCLVTCRIKASSSCQSEDKTINLQMNFLNSLGTKTKNSTVVQPIKVLKSKSECEGAQS